MKNEKQTVLQILIVAIATVTLFWHTSKPSHSERRTPASSPYEVSISDIQLPFGQRTPTTQSPESAPAESGSASAWTTCRLKTGDVGDIEVSARTFEQAFEAVAHQCFQRRQAQYEQVKGQPLGEDPGTLYIELCTNEIRCG